MKLNIVNTTADPEDRPVLSREDTAFAQLWLDSHGGQIVISVRTVPEMLPFLQELAKAALHLCQVIERKAAEQRGGGSDVAAHR